MSFTRFWTQTEVRRLVADPDRILPGRTYGACRKKLANIATWLAAGRTFEDYVRSHPRV